MCSIWLLWFLERRVYPCSHVAEQREMRQPTFKLAGAIDHQTEAVAMSSTYRPTRPTKPIPVRNLAGWHVGGDRQSVLRDSVCPGRHAPPRTRCVGGGVRRVQDPPSQNPPQTYNDFCRPSSTRPSTFDEHLTPFGGKRNMRTFRACANRPRPLCGVTGKSRVWVSRLVWQAPGAPAPSLRPTIKATAPGLVTPSCFTFDL